jgi:hypothetical protein
MPTIALAAYSIYQGVQAGQQADKDRADRNKATSAATGIGLEDRDYYRKKFGPANQIDYAMGNKPSPYLAKAKGQIEQGYQKGMTQLNEISGNQNLGTSGIGQGQKIGLDMESAKAKASLDLQDQAQRYGVAQSLGGMENASLQGSQTAARSYGDAAGYAQGDANRNESYQNQAFSDAGSSVNSYFDQLGKDKGTWYGVPTGTQTAKIEAGGDKKPVPASGK